MLDEDHYEPSEEELREIEDMIREDEEKDLEEYNKFNKFIKREPEPKTRNRLIYEFKTESHWEGWLKIHGIKW